MLNLNKVGRPVCKIVGGKYNGHLVSVGDSHGGGAEADDDKDIIKEFKRLNISKDSKLQHTKTPTPSVRYCISQVAVDPVRAPTRGSIWRSIRRNIRTILYTCLVH